MTGMNFKTRQALALKKYYSLQLEELSQQLELLEQYLSCCQEIEIKSTALFDESSDYKELLSSCLQEFPDELEDWIKADYGHNPNYPEHLLHKTPAGHNVRSKSEVIIANSLFINKIPYRYECALPLEDTVFYPDFTICHPQTLEIFYWEHFGMMDNHDYMVNSFNKLKLYASQNIIPSVNLITTFETLEHPLDSNKIQQIIQEYFL